MSSSNYIRNKAAIDQYRKELMAMLDDVQQVDKKVLNTAVNQGVQYAKKFTPVGEHPNPVTFTIKNGPDAGEVVSFTFPIRELVESFGRGGTKSLPSESLVELQRIL